MEILRCFWYELGITALNIFKFKNIFRLLSSMNFTKIFTILFKRNNIYFIRQGKVHPLKGNLRIFINHKYTHLLYVLVTHKKRCFYILLWYKRFVLSKNFQNLIIDVIGDFFMVFAVKTLKS